MKSVMIHLKKSELAIKYRGRVNEDKKVLLYSFKSFLITIVLFYLYEYSNMLSLFIVILNYRKRENT